MAEISALQVKELREKTGAGMMDCRKALVDTNGNMENAVDILRKSGAAKAEKKASRTVKEGIISSCISGNKGTLVEVLCETDFVAKNEKFREFVKGIASNTANIPGDGDVIAKVVEKEKEALTQNIAVTGENMQIRRAVKWESKGTCAMYLHMGGKIGVMIDVEGNISNTAALNDICMHIAAFKPQYLNPESIPADIITKEKEIAAAQLGDKPAAMLEKILLGKINKWYTEVCLTKQPWLRDDKQSVEKANPGVVIKRFLRWEVGEEI
ncbi:MAG TPA: elongation factor Ts [Lentisphaeria bacterium]|nr:MAG: translation elongation factor Ts [Lentisphaerae bacterium GWF2_49_21]HBC85849.1 elongation factor Ts [Lentisphaeria bacterium]